MAVHWIDSRHPLPPCGSCGRPLKPTVVHEVFAVEHSSEIPTKIKDGSVNLGVCTQCPYHGWIWPHGFLCVDLGKARAVFCVYQDMEQAEGWLTQRWTALENLIGPEKLQGLRERTVWVYHYEHIYAVLCSSDSVFDIDVATDAQFRRRQRIVDVTERARQWLTDALKAKVITYRSAELTYDFRVALIKTLRDYLSGPHEKGAEEAFRNVLETLEQRPQEPEEPTPASLAPLPRGETPTDEQRIGATNFEQSQSREIIAVLRGFSRKPLASHEGDAADAMNRELFRSYRDARRWLSDPGATVDDDGLPDPLEQMLRDVPDQGVQFGAETVTLSTFLQQADASDSCVQHLLAEIAMTGERELFGAGLARHLARLWRRTGGLYARFTASLLCAEYFASQGIPDGYIASLADACLTFETAEAKDRYFIMPDGGPRLIAICWQRMGRQLSQMGDRVGGVLCGAISVRYFEFAGDIEGKLRSRLDVLSDRMELHDPARSADARALLREILQAQTKSANPRSSVVLRRIELECRALLAYAQIRESPRRYPTLCLEMDVGWRPEEGETTDCTEPELILIGFVDNPEKDTETLHPAAAEEKAKSHSVTLTRVILDEQTQYVAGVVCDIDWVNTLRTMQAQAAEYGDSEWWYAASARLIEMGHVIDPGVPLYFYRVMESEAHERNMGKMPESLILPVLAAVAYAEFMQRRHGKPSAGQVANIERLLDVLQANALSPSFEMGVSTEQEGERGSLLGSKINPEALKLVAELLEAGGRYAEAARKLQAYTAYCERTAASSFTPGMVLHLAGERATALYRLARVALKSYRETRDYSWLVLALDAIEAYRARSTIPQSTVPEECAAGEAERVSQFPMLSLSELSVALPPDSFVMIFALLQETPLNPGFWFSALIRSNDGRIFCPRFMEFNEMYEPAKAAVDAFNDARLSLAGLTPAAAREAGSQFDPRLNAVLENLGDAIFSQEVVDFLENADARRLLIVPEAYLFDVPFPALRIGAHDAKRFLFQLNRAHGTTISIAPNLTHFEAVGISNGPRWMKREFLGLTASLCAQPEWRPDLARLYGVLPAIRKILAGVTERTGLEVAIDDEGHSVQAFLNSLGESRLALFFGHGELTEDVGCRLIAQDGPITKYEVEAYTESERLVTKVLVLCACSGLQSQFSKATLNKDLVGVHISLLRGGIRCILGSLVPTFPICGLLLLENLLTPPADDAMFDERLQRAYVAFSSHPYLASPVFWGHIVGFGNCFLTLSESSKPL